MANLFDRKPNTTASPGSAPAKPTGGRDLFGNAVKTKAPPPKANSGVISDKAAAELKATAAEAAEKMKAGAGKLADQAGDLAQKASTQVQAVKVKVSQVSMPRVPKNALIIGAVAFAVGLAGAYAWHIHQTVPVTKEASAPKSEPASSATVTKAPAPAVEASIPAAPVSKPAPVVEAPRPAAVAPITTVPVVAPNPAPVPVAPAPKVTAPFVAQATPSVTAPKPHVIAKPKPHSTAQDAADEKMLQQDSTNLDNYFKQQH
jgi:hypothetical protein